MISQKLITLSQEQYPTPFDVLPQNVRNSIDIKPARFHCEPHSLVYLPNFFCHSSCTPCSEIIKLFDVILNYFKENSIREWSFKRAVTIEAYADYDPIPVPLNIIYRFGKLLWHVAGITKDKDTKKAVDIEVILRRFF